MKIMSITERIIIYKGSRWGITTDSLVTRIKNNQEEILMIKRKNRPFKGYFALPGGFLNYDQEKISSPLPEELYDHDMQNAFVNGTLDKKTMKHLMESLGCQARELFEETGLLTINARLIGAYSDPGRDPRGHIITHLFSVDKYVGVPNAGDDAQEYCWMSYEEVQKKKRAFDTNILVQDAQEWKKHRGIYVYTK